MAKNAMPGWESKKTDAKPCATDGEVVPDRRRPGRVDFSNSWLIALLRGEFWPGAPSPTKADDTLTERASSNGDGSRGHTDDLTPARGIAISLGLGAALWFVIGLLVWLCIRLL